MITIKTMIDSKIIYNFFFQLKIKEHNIVEIDIKSQNLRFFDDTALKTHVFYNFDVDVINQRNKKSRSQQKFLKIDIIEIDMILRMSFLQNVNSIID